MPKTFNDILTPQDPRRGARVNLGAMYYDNRGMAFSGSYQATAEETAQKMINSFVLSLRHAEEDGE